MPDELMSLSHLTKADQEMSEVERLIAEAAKEDESAYLPVPTRVKIAPGGIGVFATDDAETFAEFGCIVAVSQIARAYWPERSTGKRPMCSSPDGSMGIFNPELDSEQFAAAASVSPPHRAIPLVSATAELPEKFECADCPMNVWGSTHQGGQIGRGKACKELRRLVLLVQGWTEPAMITLPPTSLKAWDTYCSALARRKSAYFAVWTRLSLENTHTADGEPYSVVKMASGPALNPDELRSVMGIRKDYADLVRELEITGSEYEVVDDVVNAAMPPSTGEADVPF